MRLIKQIILGIILVAIAVVAVANRQLVTLQLVPDPLEPLLPVQNAYTMPLFLVIILAIIVGMFLGYLIEYLRERKHRRKVVETRREMSRLEGEVAKMKKKSGEQEDDILALLN